MSQKPSDRRHREPGDEEALDLDVTPFLNIMFMLILSTMTLTAWTQLAMLNVQAPQIGGGNVGDGSAGDDVPASQLNLTVFVMKDGFNIGATGATLDGNSEGRPGQPLIPKIQVTEGGKSTITYDFQALQRRLIEIKKTFPIEQSMILSADADVQYDDVVHVMDAARKSADGTLLFPSVAFAAGIVG
ncbi:MAG: biopolymer transporter ExbD [Deltaproteobacteria bacterium]|nr:biopolymer transporter ExbD [Deltaproteobacteria bacterium]